MIDARPYQRQAVAEVYTLLPRTPRILLVAPTGSGKTVMATITVMDALARGVRVLFVVDRDELVRQTEATLTRSLPSGTAVGIVKAGYPENRSARLQIASRQTMERRDWWRGWMAEGNTLAIIDEAHKTAFAKVIRTVVEGATHVGAAITGAKLRILGLTATPWRLSRKEGLGDLFDSMVTAPTPAQLIEMGYLLQPVYMGLPAMDVSGVKVSRSTGDFEAGDLDRVCNTSAAVASLHASWRKHTPGRRTIVFAVSVAHAKAIAEYWTAQGDPAHYIEADTPGDERRRCYAALRNGSAPTLVSVGVLTEGFDETSVEVVILARPTQSVALHHQMIGRGLRTHRPCHACGGQVPVDQEGPDVRCRCGAVQGPEHRATWQRVCMVLDQAGNVDRLGMPDLLTRYEMTTGTGGGPGPMPTKRCPECDRLLHLAAKVCDKERGGCGYVWPVRAREAAVGEMRLIERSEAKRATYIRAARLAYSKGWSPGFARQDYLRRLGEEPDTSWDLHSIFDGHPLRLPSQLQLWGAYLERVAEKKVAKDSNFNLEQWVAGWMRRQFGAALKKDEKKMHSALAIDDR